MTADVLPVRGSDSPAGPAGGAGRFALVTGGGTGIGRATALLLAARGVDVALLGRRAAPLEETARAVRAIGARAVAIPSDVSRAEDVEAATAAALAFGSAAPMAVIHSAGIVLRGTAHEMSEEAFDAVLGTNLKGVFLVTRALLPAMLAAGRGRVVAIGSISSTLGTAGASAYNASKWGLVGYVKSLAEELRGKGLQALAVLPGSVDTAMLVGGPYAPEMSAEDVARVVVFAALDAPAAMNGSAIESFGP